jgi:hypothetical protein
MYDYSTSRSFTCSLVITGPLGRDSDFTNTLRLLLILVNPDHLTSSNFRAFIYLERYESILYAESKTA